MAVLVRVKRTYFSLSINTNLAPLARLRLRLFFSHLFVVDKTHRKKVSKR